MNYQSNRLRKYIYIFKKRKKGKKKKIKTWTPHKKSRYQVRRSLLLCPQATTPLCKPLSAPRGAQASRSDVRVQACPVRSYMLPSAFDRGCDGRCSSTPRRQRLFENPFQHPRSPRLLIWTSECKQPVLSAATCPPQR